MQGSPTIGPETGAFAVRDFSQLAGDIVEPERAYRVRYRGVHASAGRRSWLVSLLIITLNVVFEAAFVYWLLQPSHQPDTDPNVPWALAANIFVISSIALVELLRLINVFSLSIASMLARDPIPVRPDPRLRVAFLTTIVPGKEPLEMVQATLQAARRIRHDGVFHVWLLDEGDDPDVKAMCLAEGVRHFSRKGKPEYNRASGHFKAKTKHGNYNAWVDRYGHRYEVFLSVDPDHVPLPNYAERMLGYFRDPDVAYVVGPQCYANVDNFVTKGAESQQFPFHSVIQRAANAYDAAMLVGTNNAIRIDALVCIGGLEDSITEDMATGLSIHTRRNPVTGAKWKSVYTPDVVAVGEGPSSWGDYFSQQLRWSRGTFEILAGPFWRRIRRLPPGRILHYVLITTFYPSMAIGWILGSINAVLYLTVGVSGIVVPPQLWLALYIDATAFQMWVYIRNRRYNVSPYEAEDSPGVRGMAMSVISSPIYASSLIATLLRRPAKFVVTPKSGAGTQDRLATFRRHLQWSVLLAAALTASVLLGYANIDVMMWPALALLISLTPVALWWLNADVAASTASAAGVVDAAVDADPVVMAQADRPDDLAEDDEQDDPERTVLLQAVRPLVPAGSAPAPTRPAHQAVSAHAAGPAHPLFGAPQHGAPRSGSSSTRLSEPRLSESRVGQPRGSQPRVGQPRAPQPGPRRPGRGPAGRPGPDRPASGGHDSGRSESGRPSAGGPPPSGPGGGPTAAEPVRPDPVRSDSVRPDSVRPDSVRPDPARPGRVSPGPAAPSPTAPGSTPAPAAPPETGSAAPPPQNGGAAGPVARPATPPAPEATTSAASRPGPAGPGTNRPSPRMRPPGTRRPDDPASTPTAAPSPRPEQPRPSRPDGAAPDPGAEASRAEAPATSTTRVTKPGAEAPQTKTPQAKTPQAKTPQAKTPQAKTPQAKTPQTETPAVDATRVTTSRAETPRAETSGAETPRAEASRAETPRAETPRAEAPRAEAPADEAPGPPAPGASVTATQVVSPAPVVSVKPRPSPAPRPRPQATSDRPDRPS